MIETVEALERRLLFTIDVTAKVLASPLFEPGNQWTYDYTVGDQTGTVIRTVIGQTTLSNGQKAWEIDDTTPGVNAVSKVYYGLDSAGDYVQYGSATVASPASSSDLYSQPLIYFPAEMAQDTPYNSSVTDTQTITNTQGVTSTSQSTKSVTVTLSSETPGNWTVDFGTFSAYQVTVVNEAGGTETEYDSPEYGLLESDDSSSSGNTTLKLVNFTGNHDNLSFTNIPTVPVPVGKAINPPLNVEVRDNLGNLDENATGDVTLTLNSASRLGTSPGTLSGTTEEPIEDGVATFSDLKISAAGAYTFTASDTAGDTQKTSPKFSVGKTALTLEITPTLVSIKGDKSKGAATGDKILYNVLVTSKYALQSQSLVITFPTGFPVLNNGGGTVSGNTITYTGIGRAFNFELKVPDATVLNGIKKIVVSGDDNVVYTNNSPDEATASSSVKLATSYEIDGTVYDGIFRFPQIGTVVTSAQLAGVTVQMINSDGAVVDSGTTGADGKFSVTAKEAGTYTILFATPVKRYSTGANEIGKADTFASRTVTLEKSNTTAIDLGKLVLPKTFLDTAATILNNLNNYKTSAWGGLSSADVDLWQFDTTGAESALDALMGTRANPGVFMNPLALRPGQGSDAWVAAIRMMAGLWEVNQRFNDAFKLVDYSGKALSVVLSALIVKTASIKAAAAGGAPEQGPLTLEEYNKQMNQLFGQGLKIAGFTTLGQTVSYWSDKLLAKLDLPTTYKSAVISAVFTTLRYGYDLLTGTNLAGDLLFEEVFNLIRISFDTLMLQSFAGVSLRPDVPDLVLGATAIGVLPGTALQGLPGNMQDVINTCVNNRGNYDTQSDTDSVLDTLDSFEDQEHQRQTVELTLVSGINNAASVLRGIAGAGGVLNKSGVAINGNSAQKAVQGFISKISGAFSSVIDGGAKDLSAEILIPAFASSAFGFIEQLYNTNSVPNIVQYDSNTLSPSVVRAEHSAARSTSAGESASASRVGKAGAAALSTDASTFIADLNALSGQVNKAKSTKIEKLYPQLVSDEQALFGNDLVLLDDRANALQPHLSKSDAAALSNFDLAMQAAIPALSFAFAQLQAWSSDVKTGNKADVVSEIGTAISEVTLAAQDAAAVRKIVAGQTVPVTLAIDETSVPTTAAAGTTQTFTFTVTNVGDVASSAGTITFTNGDGSLEPVAPTLQTLAALAPGASATYTWQVQVNSPTSANSGAVFEVDAVAGDATASVTDSVTVG
jgi:hypothetical protein